MTTRTTTTSTSTIASPIIRRRRLRGARSRSETPSRSAAIGVTREARNAGISPAITVTAVPASSDTQIVRNSSTVPLSGRSAPNALKSWSSAGASASPAARPIVAPPRPSITPSTTTEASSCERVAPSVRSRPNSRVRCATVIENVLKMMKAPTNSAT